MEKHQHLLATLEKCLPQLDIAPLQADLPSDSYPETAVSWLYEHLSVQNLMIYEEWTEYFGAIPELTPLTGLVISADPATFIFSLVEKIDWSTASIDPYELPYMMPWLEHINFYLKPFGARLVDILPLENAYIMCVRDDDSLLMELHSALQALGLGLNSRQPMDQHEVAVNFDSLVSG